MEFFQLDGEERPDISSIISCFLSIAISESISLAVIPVFMNLLLGSCRLGTETLDCVCHMAVAATGDEAPDGVRGGVEDGGIKTDGEPSDIGLSEPISNVEAVL
jgi:hypothetical protein